MLMSFWRKHDDLAQQAEKKMKMDLCVKWNASWAKFKEMNNKIENTSREIENLKWTVKILAYVSN